MPNRTPRAASHGLVALLLITCACRRDDRAAPPPLDAGEAPSAAPAPPPPAPPRFEPTPWLTTLEVSGFAAAAVSLPWGEARRWPIVVAAHGYDDRPESFCDNARFVFENTAFVLCPRGVPAPGSGYGGSAFASEAALEREIDAGVAALGARWPERVDADGPRVFFGFSQGASLGARLVQRAPARYPRVVLSEGGEEAWGPAAARAFVRGGGARVLFACGLRARLPAAQRAASWLEGDRGRAALGKLPGKPEFIH